MPAYSNLPISHLLGTISVEDANGCTARTLAGIIQRFSEDPHAAFTHMMPVSGLPGSCRLILTHPHPEAVQLLKKYDAKEMAHEIVYEFSAEARFPPRPMDEGSAQRSCFSIRRIIIDRHPGLLITAGWERCPD